MFLIKYIQLYIIIQKYTDNSSNINSFTKTEEFLTFHFCNGSDYGNYNLTKNNLYCIDWENKNFLVVIGKILFYFILK